MQKSETIYYLALQAAKGIGDITAKKLISACGGAEAVFKEKNSLLAKINGIGKQVVNNLKRADLFAQAEKEWDFIEKNEISALSFDNPDYPEYLKQCVDGPLVLFQQGKIDLKNKKIISIVGTRNITNYGREFLRTFFEELKKHNPVIVSGLAYGVDVFAHRLAVEHGLQTIGVLAHGLDRIYPKVHQKVVGAMLQNGGLMTDFWSGTNPDRENFIKRNRIVAGISQATIVIESAQKGGSLITADIAHSYNRDVFAVPGRVTDTYSSGCNQLIKTNKAAMLTSVKDLEYMLNWDLEENTNAKPVQKQLFTELTPTEKKLYDYLQENGKQNLDQIALYCGFPIHQTATTLFNLEMKGAVRALPGKLFEPI